MDKKDLGSVYGQGAEALLLMAKLFHQIRKQGGSDDCIKRLGNDDRILERVAKVLARADRLVKPFDIWTQNGPESWIKIFLLGLKSESIHNFTEESLPNECRLATKTELEYLLEDNPGFLQDEDDLVIVGERIASIGNDARHWTLTRDDGVKIRYISAKDVIDFRYSFATTFKS